MKTAGVPQPDPVSGIILAGGRSRRLGIDKSTMPWPPAGAGGAGSSGATTLLEATGTKLEQVCAEVLVVAYRGERSLPYAVVPDLYEDGGSLGGIYSGLFAASCEYALAVATDMPFLSPALLQWMLEQPRDFDALVPVRDGPEPLHALYSKRCLEPMRKRLDAGRLRITALFDDVKVRYVSQDELTRLDPDGLSFFNVNTPEDLAQARALVESRFP